MDQKSGQVNRAVHRDGDGGDGFFSVHQWSCQRQKKLWNQLNAFLMASRGSSCFAENAEEVQAG
jgi:hypothetical protein